MYESMIKSITIPSKKKQIKSLTIYLNDLDH